MALSKRYRPSIPPNEAAAIGIDLSTIIPPGVSLTSATLTILTNINPPAPSTDFTQQPVTTIGRQAWCHIQGGVPGTDYQFRWSCTDTESNIWNRTALGLCATSS